MQMSQHHHIVVVAVFAILFILTTTCSAGPVEISVIDHTVATMGDNWDHVHTIRVLFDFSKENPNLPSTFSTWLTPSRIRDSLDPMAERLLYRSQPFLSFGGDLFTTTRSGYVPQCTFTPLNPVYNNPMSQSLDIAFNTTLDNGDFNQQWGILGSFHLNGLASARGGHPLRFEPRDMSTKWEFKCTNLTPKDNFPDFYLTIYNAQGTTPFLPPVPYYTYVAVLDVLSASNMRLAPNTTMIEVPTFAAKPQPFLTANSTNQDGIGHSNYIVDLGSLEMHGFTILGPVTMRNQTHPLLSTRIFSSGDITSQFITSTGHVFTLDSPPLSNTAPMMLPHLRITPSGQADVSTFVRENQMVSRFAVPLSFRDEHLFFNPQPIVHIYDGAGDLREARVCTTSNVRPCPPQCPEGSFGIACELLRCNEVTTSNRAITLSGHSRLLDAAEDEEMRSIAPTNCASFSPWIITTHNPLFLKLLGQSVFSGLQPHLVSDILSYSFDRSTVDVSPITFTATQFGLNTGDLWLSNLYFHDVSTVPSLEVDASERVVIEPDTSDVVTTPVAVTYTNIPTPALAPLRISVTTTRRAMSLALTRGKSYYVTHSRTYTYRDVSIKIFVL